MPGNPLQIQIGSIIRDQRSLTVLETRDIQPSPGVRIGMPPCCASPRVNALMKGVDCITVSTLMGHSDPSTLAKVYQHLGQNPKFLREQLQRATG